MNKVWAVIRREFIERVRTRAFLIGTLLGPLLLGLLFVVPALLSRSSRAKQIVVLDAATGQFGSRVEQALAAARRDDKADGEARYVVKRIEAQGRVDAVQDSLVQFIDRRDLGPENLDGIVLVTDDVLVTDTLRYLGANVGSPAEVGQLSRTLRQAVLYEKLTRAGIDPGIMVASLRPLELSTAKVSQGRLTGQSGEASFMLAYFMSFLLYIALLLYGVQVMTSTVEEKTNRINEVLVSSLTPFQLLLGKVLGVGSVALLQLSIWAGAAWGLTRYRVQVAGLFGSTPESAAALPIPQIPGDVLVVFLLFFALGFLFYSAGYAAVGSTCNTVQETQQASIPLTLFVAGGLLLMFGILDEPNGQLARIMSLVPFFAPFVTPVRNSLSPVPLPELLTSVLVMILGVLAMAWVAGRIYRTGILMYGKRATIGEMVRWLRVG